MEYSSLKLIKELTCSVSAHTAAKMVQNATPGLEVSEWIEDGEYYSFSRNDKTLLTVATCWELKLENGDYGSMVSIFSPDHERPFFNVLMEAIAKDKCTDIGIPKMEEVIKTYPELVAAIGVLTPFVYEAYDPTS